MAATIPTNEIPVDLGNGYKMIPIEADLIWMVARDPSSLPRDRKRISTRREGWFDERADDSIYLVQTEDLDSANSFYSLGRRKRLLSSLLKLSDSPMREYVRPRDMTDIVASSEYEPPAPISPIKVDFIHALKSNFGMVLFARDTGEMDGLKARLKVIAGESEIPYVSVPDSL